MIIRHSFIPKVFIIPFKLHRWGWELYLEKTSFIDIKEGNVNEVVTDHGSIMADNVVIATNTPVYDPDRLRNHLHPEGSFVIGLYANNDFPDGMFIENEPVHTYRTTPTNKGQMIIVAGEHSPLGCGR